MKAKMILSLLAVSATLAGCSEKSESVSNSEPITQSESSTSQQNNTADTQKKDVSGAFAPVLEDIKLVKQSNATKNLKAISSEVASNILNYQQDVKYTFYDINKDGKDELLLGTKGRDGYFTLAAYYLDGSDKIVTLGDSLALNGGYRSDITIYQDGSIYSAQWRSMSGDGMEHIYKITEGGATLEKVASGEFEQLKWQLQNKNGLTKANELDLNALEWKNVN